MYTNEEMLDLINQTSHIIHPIPNSINEEFHTLVIYLYIVLALLMLIVYNTCTKNDTKNQQKYFEDDDSSEDNDSSNDDDSINDEDNSSSETEQFDFEESMNEYSEPNIDLTDIN